ncbi:MAG: hypothetical protein CMD35_00085 [Flavobacteriales bacterium]|nr:hypothetical protein [Flavobacteriales bacterium]
MFNLRKLIVLIVLTSVLSACKMGKQVHSFFSPISENELAVINDSKFIDAISFKNSGDFEKAIELLNQIIKTKGEKAPAYFELAKIFRAKSKNEQAVEYINYAVDLNPKNKWYINYKINLTRELGLYDQCEKTYLLRQKTFPSNTDYDIELSDFYVFRKNYTKALKIHNKIEEKIGISHNINFNKFLIYKGLNNYEKSEEEIKKLISTFPGNSNYYIHFADFKFQHGEDSSALQIYDEALQFIPNNPYILNELAKYYFLDHQKEKAKSLYKEIIKNPGFELPEKRHILNKFKRLSEFDESLFGFTKSIMILASNLHPYDPSINLITADYIYDSQNYKESIYYYEKVVEVKPNDYGAWIQLVISYYNISNYREMLKKSSDALVLFPTQPSFYLYNGIARIQMQQYERAIEILEEGNDLIVSTDKKLKAQFLSSLGDVYHAFGEHQKSDDYFELSLELDSENYFVLNNYAYYLSERNVKLEKAKKMSEKSNLLNPGEASFEDTYGWILFQLGKYEEALNWLKKSELNGGNSSAVINEHIGDVYEKLGQREKALKYWKLANHIGGGSEQLLNKLKQK